MSIYSIDEKIEEWINSNHVAWMVILFVFAIFMNILMFYIIGNPKWIVNGLAMGIVYGIIFLLVDYFSHTTK